MPMKSYASYQDWMKDQSEKNQSIIKALRAFIKNVSPQLEETVKWGNGCYVGKNNGVIYLYADREWVQFGFFNGVSLSDPKKKLEGNSNYIRHIKVRSPAEIDKAYFTNLLEQAVKSEAERPNLPTKNRAIFESLSKPALGALAEAKITTLTKLAKFTETELLALHGLGPGSITILREALKAKNLAFKTEKPAGESPKPKKRKKTSDLTKVAKTKIKDSKKATSKKAK